MGQIFSKMMMGGGNEADPQKAAASRVTASGKPSLLQMQEGMGGLLTNDGMKQAATGLLGDVSGDFKSAFNDIGSFATNIFGSNPATAFFGQATGQPVQQPAQMIPEQGIIAPPPEPVAPPVAEPPPPVSPPPQDNGWGNVQTDNDAINWALSQGSISPQEAAWLRKWQGEANDGDNWVDGSGGTKKWDYMNSGLTNQNKQTVDKFYKSISGNWGDSPAQPSPQQPANTYSLTPDQLASIKRFGGGPRR